MPEENGPVSGTLELSDWNFISEVMDMAGQKNAEGHCGYRGKCV